MVDGSVVTVLDTETRSPNLSFHTIKIAIIGREAFRLHRIPVNENAWSSVRQHGIGKGDARNRNALSFNIFDQDIDITTIAIARSEQAHAIRRNRIVWFINRRRSYITIGKLEFAFFAKDSLAIIFNSRRRR